MPSADPRTVALSQLRPGQSGVIHHANLQGSDADLIRAMGLHNEARVRLCRAGEPCIVAVSSSLVSGKGGNDCGCGSSCRIGLARPFADRIFVAPEP